MDPAGSGRALAVSSAVTATALLVIILGAAAAAAAAGDVLLAVPAAGGATPHCNGSIAQCAEGVEWPPTEAGGGIIHRRTLAGGPGYVSYHADRDRSHPPYGLPKSGYSYGRGCNNRFGCRRESYIPGHN